MKYYVVSDIHGYYSILKSELERKGFFSEKAGVDHKLVVCGDLFDRGKRARELQDFILDLMSRDEVILIRGNHEDLMLSLLDDELMWFGQNMFYSHHQSNGTVGTVLQLTKSSVSKVVFQPDLVRNAMGSTPFIRKIIPAMVDFFETTHYIFVHGWIPCHCIRINQYAEKFEFNPNWRKSSVDDWNFARWTNGMNAAKDGVIEPEKTIVCGHWHCSFGHSKLEGKGSEFGKDADFTPYFSKGIIAIDACTAESHSINCLVLED